MSEKPPPLIRVDPGDPWPPPPPVPDAADSLQKRIDAVLACPTAMCGHCIEILTGEIPPSMSVAEYLGPCTEFRRAHLYQTTCSDCGKPASEHPKDEALHE